MPVITVEGPALQVDKKRTLVKQLTAVGVSVYDIRSTAKTESSLKQRFALPSWC